MDRFRLRNIIKAYIIYILNAYVLILYVLHITLSIAASLDIDNTTEALVNLSTADANQTDYSGVHLKCPSELNCDDLGPDCIDCKFNHSCVYGLDTTAECWAKEGVTCVNVTNKPLKLTFNCRYCYQLDPSQYSCNRSVSCSATKGRYDLLLSVCSTNANTMCMGNRIFYKRTPCNWTSGYRWSTALILSITLGGFGADRFYLGLWQEGIGKLFSFGGLGVWTIVDVILIAIGYVTPADGSLYL